MGTQNSQLRYVIKYMRNSVFPIIKSTVDALVLFLSILLEDFHYTEFTMFRP